MSPKAKKPVVLDEAYHFGWPGYEGDMEWGPLFIMQWPVVHPDSHCQKHTYTPDEQGLCSCMWVPKETICCEECNETIRHRFERYLLREMIEESPYSPERLVFEAYLAYVETFKDQLDGTPDLEAVYKWFNDLGWRKKREIFEKIELPRPRVSLTFGIGGSFSDSMDSMFESILEGVLKDAPKDVLEHMLEDEDCPAHVQTVARKLLNKEE